ncbi:hypothetical protein LUZ61_020559 [Rhynchospora tenuis]|uniref:HTH myb-type domain-containing protein n=1 Tax=Rhynchospora tenuis TaxID=198213 RepID=A0AAD6ENW8_9POAL|nr:hypothetical protein LUZ61_020559 [Rhynchospora tenuis]
MDKYYSENPIGAFDLISDSSPLVLPTLHVQPNLTDTDNPQQVMMESASMLHSGMFEGTLLMDNSNHLQSSTTMATDNLGETADYWDRMFGTLDDTGIMESPLIVLSSSNMVVTQQQLIGLQPAIPEPVPGPVLSDSSINSPPRRQVKSRLRWTNELNNIFVDAVNRLGGREKATPANILKSMKVDGLKLHHVKSHLQKYRACCLIEESYKANGGSHKKGPTEQEPSPIEAEKDLALNLQCDIQKLLAEHTEVQRKIQLSVEEQGKQLQMLLENQVKSMESTSSNGRTVIPRCP